MASNDERVARRAGDGSKPDADRPRYEWVANMHPVFRGWQISEDIQRTASALRWLDDYDQLRNTEGWTDDEAREEANRRELAREGQKGRRP